VNTSDIDFVDRNEDLQELLRKVTEPIKGSNTFCRWEAGSGGSVSEVGEVASERNLERTTGSNGASLSPPFS